MTTAVHNLVNGVEQDHIALGDRGLQFGDGLFETLCVRAGQARYWERHMARLRAGCARLGLPPPDEQRLHFEVGRLIRQQPHGVVKILLTRGTGGRGYSPPADVEVCRIVRYLPRPVIPAEGLRLARCTTTLGLNPRLAGIKHLNRLEQVLASHELTELHADEGLLADSEGMVIEGTRSNLFLVHQGELITPDLGQCGVAGVLRSVVLDTCSAADIACHIREVTWSELEEAEELFMTNSLMGIQPVIRFADRTLPVGERTRQLQQLVMQAPEGEGWHP
ncbi:MAG: aminodeoxychorismate lyase [Gammaproteobacteria bacterium]|nr:aminodeoxychorismate lyase [Gammaproteobacteria bacterium]